jgi:transposase
MRKPKRVWDAETLLRSQTLLDVTAGRKSSKEAAQALGVSRKTWHAWQRRGLEGLLEGMSRRPPGRRAPPADPEKAALRKRVSELEAKVSELERSLRILKAVGLPGPRRTGGVKKKRKGRRKR